MGLTMGHSLIISVNTCEILGDVSAEKNSWVVFVNP
jgi:hypothetical protein